MITFPCAKINLGLNIVSKRADGYHNLETVFYPIPLTDALEIKLMGDEFPSEVACDLKITGNAVDCDEQKNLVVKAYNMLAADFKIPRIHTHLVKRIPSQAGMGGGSADAAYMIRLLDERFRLNIGIPEMERYAAKLGADCAYFISADPENGDTACYAEGIGDVLMPASGPGDNMKGYYIVIVKRDDIAVSTKDAYAAITPKKPAKCCRDIVRQPIETWKDELVNDFEAPIFAMHPELAALKATLGGVVIAIAGNVLLNAGIQMATRLDGRKLGALVGALAAGGVAATGKRGPRQRKHAGASQLQKVTARHGRPRHIRHVHHRA